MDKSVLVCMMDISGKKFEAKTIDLQEMLQIGEKD